MSEVKQRIAMKAVIVSGGKVLVLREAHTYEEGTNHGRYGLPGGRIEPGEPFEEGLKREVREETGLDIEIIRPVYVGEWQPVIKEVPHQIIAVFFLCEPRTKHVTLSKEHGEYKWIGQEEMAEVDLMPPQESVLTLTFDEMGETTS